MSLADQVALEQVTYIPSSSEGDQLAVVHDFMIEQGRAGLDSIAARYFLVGAAAGEPVELPPQVREVLRQVVDAMRQGLAVTVVPQAHVLTTQQVADLLGVSRPTVIKLLDGGQLPFSKAGSHRRVRVEDVLAYRQRRRAEQYAALEATADYAVEENLEEVLSGLRRARKAVAASRRLGG